MFQSVMLLMPEILHQLRLVVFLIPYRVSYIAGGARRISELMINGSLIGGLDSLDPLIKRDCYLGTSRIPNPRALNHQLTISILVEGVILKKRNKTQ